MVTSCQIPTTLVDRPALPSEVQLLEPQGEGSRGARLVRSVAIACRSVGLLPFVLGSVVTCERQEPRRPARFDADAVVRALQEVDASECYFLAPAGPLPFLVTFAPNGAVAAVRAEKVEGAAIDCLLPHLRAVRIPSFHGRSFTVRIDQPHALDLSVDEKIPYSRPAILSAVTRANLDMCHALPGPRHGVAMLITDPKGGFTDVFVRGDIADQPLGKCVERWLMMVQTPSYNGGPVWLLVDYVVPESR
jgi:hypothetical protein